MADIFISYSHADRDLARRLSVSLESEGYTVWWDRSLKVGDEYRRRITDELVKARVTIVIWSDDSIRSEWVRAEASYAKAHGKLVPVRTAAVSYSEIPLPFGELQTVPIGEWQLINAAVMERLNAPSAKTSTLRIAGKVVSFQFLTWLGIVGAAVSLFTSASALIKLADWARWVVNNWRHWMQFVWEALATRLGIPNVPPQIAPLLTFVAFSGMLAVGLRYSEMVWPVAESPAAEPRLVRRMTMYAIISLPAASLLIWDALYSLDYIGTTLPVSLTAAASFAALIIVVGLIYGSDRKLECAIAMSLYAVLAAMALFLPLHDMLVEVDTDLSAAEEGISERPNLSDAATYRRSLELGIFLRDILGISIPTFLLALVFVMKSSRPRALLRRLSFIVIGVGSLLLMNQISVLRLHEYLKPPS